MVLPGQDPEGRYVLSVLLKRTYRIVPGERCVRAEEDRKLVTGDEHYGDPRSSSVRFESDLVPWKPGTDVVVHGSVVALGGKPVDRLIASLIVAGRRKDLLVIGDRAVRWRRLRDPEIGEPEPFVEIPLRYEYAYGGVDIYSDPALPCIYPRNHLGKGFIIARKRRAVEELELPNIEDPEDPLGPERLFVNHFIYWDRMPMPQGLGWVAKYWRPRADLAGILPADREVEQELRRAYAPALPEEQREEYLAQSLPVVDFRFFNGASAGLVFDDLRGDEEIHTIHLTPGGERSFALPGERPEIALDIGEGPQWAEVALHTVQVRLEEDEIDLVWRGAIPYEGPEILPRLRKLEVTAR
jgi:hypothetical protein